MLQIRSIFFASGSADPVLKYGSGSTDQVFKIRIWIRIRVNRKRPDPTGSGSFLKMFLMCSKININFYGIFLPNLNIFMTLKITEKNDLDKTVIYTILYKEKIWITGVVFWIKDPDSGSGIFPDPQHWYFGTYSDRGA